jgi:hypothetical protein
MPEMAPPPPGFVGPVAVPAEPPAELLPNPAFEGEPGLGVGKELVGACWVRIAPVVLDFVLVAG